MAAGPIGSDKQPIDPRFLNTFPDKPLTTEASSAKPVQSQAADMLAHGQNLNTAISMLKSENSSATTIGELKQVTSYGLNQRPPLATEDEPTLLHRKNAETAEMDVRREFAAVYGKDYGSNIQFTQFEVNGKKKLLITAEGESKRHDVEGGKNLWGKIKGSAMSLAEGVKHTSRVMGSQPTVSIVYDQDTGKPEVIQKERNGKWENTSWKRTEVSHDTKVRAQQELGSTNLVPDSPTQGLASPAVPTQATTVAAMTVPASMPFPDKEALKFEFMTNTAAFYQRELEPRTKQELATMNDARKAAIAEIVKLDPNSVSFKKGMESLSTDDRSEIIAAQHVARMKKKSEKSTVTAESGSGKTIKVGPVAPQVAPSADLEVVSKALDAKIKSLGTQVESAKARAHTSDGKREFDKLSQELAGVNKLNAELNTPTPETVAGLLKFAGDEIAEKKAEQDQAKRKLDSPKVAELNIQIQALEGFQSSLKPAERPQLSHEDRVRQFDEKIAALDAKRDELFKLDPNGGGKEMQAYNSERAKLVQQRAELIRG